MEVGSISFSHQQRAVIGNSSLGKLQPGQRHCLGNPSSRCCDVPEFPFVAHLLIQPKWKTCQQVRHDHMRELR